MPKVRNQSATKAKAPHRLKDEHDLARALGELIGGCGSVNGKRHVVTTVELDFRYVSESCRTQTFFSGDICLEFKDGGESLFVCETGYSAAEAFRKCRHMLAIKLEERARKRQLQASQSAGSLVAPPPKRLTYQGAMP